MQEVINSYLLEKEAQNIAQMAVAAENECGDDPVQTIWEICDGHQWAIYYAKAFELCANCDTDEGEDYLEEIGATYEHLSDHVTKVAWATLLQTSMKKYLHYFD